MKKISLLFILFLLFGCSDDKQESKLIEIKQEVIEEEKPTYTTPKFRTNGELYSKGNRLIKVKPYKMLKAGGNVKDILLENNKLYAATDGGSVDVFDLESYKIVESIKIPSFHDDIYNKEMVPTVYSIDKTEEKIVILSSYKGVQKQLYLYENKTLHQITGLDSGLMIIKVRFIDNDTLLLGLLSNELMAYDIKQNKQIYRTKLSESSFADMALSHDKTQVVVGCESGIIYLVDTKNGQLKSVIQGANKDKSYKVAIHDNLVLSCGQDSIGALYNLQTNTFKVLQAKFLIYAGALSPDGSRAAFTLNEENELLVIDTTDSSKEAYLLSGQKSTLNAIRFRDNRNIASASDDEFIMLWQLP
ncbi:WD40 repeat domain-containing protein [bacterium]|nr:WD40 repeat domain-containing protein [bacterium]MBU1957667.1 WD40 repeat domain-containing protein [bacterium]